jgi:predicted N-formylglutamate amidohydrolase
MDNARTDRPSGSRLLLGQDDVSPVAVTNPGGASPFLLIGDHAGRAVPARLAGLGLPSAAMDGHIAWDIGVAGLGERLSVAMDATFIRQAYSRLVIDCNRRPGDPAEAPALSDGVAVPGNVGLDPEDLAARRAEIRQPYQDRIAAELDARAARSQPTLLVSLHSFTPVMQGDARPWRFGVLHRGDSALSRRVLDLLREAVGEAAGDNQPYAMDDVDYTVPLHADPRGLDYLELEVRQDLIADAAGTDTVAVRLAQVLSQAAGEALGDAARRSRGPGR